MLRQLKLIACVGLLGISTYAIALAQGPGAGSTGNPTLDHPGWIHIPGELINPSCVHQLPKGANVEVNGNGQVTGEVTVNGRHYAQYAPCSDAPVVLRPQGQTPGVSSPIGTTNQWVETAERYVSLNSSDDIDYLAANWTVPSSPSEYGAIIYLFNGIEPSTETWILQPVLQFGYNGSFGGNYWVIASWVVSPHYSFYSDPEQVYTGDVLLGTTEMIGQSTYNNTLYYEVTAQDTNSGASTWITTSTKGLHWVYGFDGTLEAYDVTSCAQYPANGSEAFTNTQFDHGYTLLTPISPQSWTADVITPNPGPACAFSVTPNAAGSTLYWTP
jgi:hypothetical protein